MLRAGSSECSKVSCRTTRLAVEALEEHLGHTCTFRGNVFGSSSRFPLFTHSRTHSLTSSSISNFKQSDIVFLDRETKTRKQAFGIEIYDLMADLETNDDLTREEKESKIRGSFDAARKDISVFAAMKESKTEELSHSIEGGETLN
jgi:hypothetical protein